MMTRTKDTLKAAIATHAHTLTILQDQAERESVTPTDGTQIATALYALTLQVAELAEATWAMRQTQEQMRAMQESAAAAAIRLSEAMLATLKERGESNGDS